MYQLPAIELSRETHVPNHVRRWHGQEVSYDMVASASTDLTILAKTRHNILCVQVTG